MASRWVIWSPVAIGCCLLAVTAFDLYQFSDRSIDTRAMLSREIPLVIGGFVLSTFVLFSGLYRLAKKQWGLALQSIVSPLLFLLLFGIGGAMGGAFMNAT